MFEIPRSNVKGYKHVDGIMLVSGKDEKDSENVANPSEGVEEINSSIRYSYR